MDYTNPFDRFKVLVVKGNVTALPVVRKKDKTFKNRLGGLDSILQGVVHDEQHELVETKEIVEVKSSDRLTSLVEKALKTQEEILDIEVRSSDENYCAIMRIKASVCEKILTTQTKVDENVLRARNDSRLGDILNKIIEAKKQLNLTVAVS